MSYNFFRMLRSVSLTWIMSDRLKAVGQSLMLFMAWAVVVTLTLVWVSLLIEGVGYISTSLTAWL